MITATIILWVLVIILIIAGLTAYDGDIYGLSALMLCVVAIIPTIISINYGIRDIFNPNIIIRNNGEIIYEGSSYFTSIETSGATTTVNIYEETPCVCFKKNLIVSNKIYIETIKGDK